MKELEARTIIENTGNYYDSEIDGVMEVYEDACKHIGFVDNRSDSRFVVKFHDIFYCCPDNLTEEEENMFENIFNEFCNDQYEYVMEEIHEKGILLDALLTSHDVGHYRGFKINIDEITEENALELAMQVYDEGYTEYIDDYVETVKILQNLEDNYMEYWIDFIDGNEFFTKEQMGEIREKWYKEKERRNAN